MMPRFVSTVPVPAAITTELSLAIYNSSFPFTLAALTNGILAELIADATPATVLLGDAGTVMVTSLIVNVLAAVSDVGVALP